MIVSLTGSHGLVKSVVSHYTKISIMCKSTSAEFEGILLQDGTTLTMDVMNDLLSLVSYYDLYVSSWGSSVTRAMWQEMDSDHYNILYLTNSFATLSTPINSVDDSVITFVDNFTIISVYDYMIHSMNNWTIPSMTDSNIPSMDNSTILSVDYCTIISGYTCKITLGDKSNFLSVDLWSSSNSKGNDPSTIPLVVPPS